MTALKKLLSVISMFGLLSCAEKQELLKNNNPDKYTLTKDVLWASPDAFDLTMDIYTPTSGKDTYPVLLVFHGGGWLINNKGIMDQASKYLASNSEYVICNINYRLLADEDNSITMDQLVEDVFGSVLWVKEHIGNYHGDFNNIAVTGDSAGGHLAAMIVNSGHLLGSNGYSEQSLRFKPSYLPTGITAEQLAKQGGISVQAAILSYGAYDLYSSSLEGLESWKNPFWLLGGSFARGIFGDEYNPADNPSLYKGVSPSYLIPKASERQLPAQLLTVGSEDKIISPTSVKTYVTMLKNAGHSAQYWEHDGRTHAFLDAGSSKFLGQSFEEDAPLALDVMITFLDSVFY